MKAWWLLAGGLLVGAAGVVLLARPGQRAALYPGHDGWDPLERVGSASVILVELVLLSLVVALLTRGHPGPSTLVREGPSRSDAVRELGLLLPWLVLVQVGGSVVGQVATGHPVSFHLHGSIHGAEHPPSVAAVALWAAYNMAAYVVLPLWWLRRRYSRRELWLCSRRPRRDVLVVLVVLVLESAAQATVFGAAFLALDVGQAARGGLLALGLSMLGTVLPTLVVVAAVIVPRVLVITGSTSAAVVVGGVSYAALHAAEGWTLWSSPGGATMSASLLVLQYLAPGMFKAFVTVRTGNAWVHAWAYHAVAPHVWADTPLFVRIFGLR